MGSVQQVLYPGRVVEHPRAYQQGTRSDDRFETVVPAGEVSRRTLLAQFDESIANLSSIAGDFSEGSQQRWMAAVRTASDLRDRLSLNQQTTDKD